MAIIVSEFIGGTDHFRTLVKTHGQYYYVDTCYVDYKYKYETIAMPCDENGDRINWDDDAVARALYETDGRAKDAQQYKMIKDGHYKVIDELEEYIKCYLNTQIEFKMSEIDDLKREIAQIAEQLELFTDNKEA